MNKVLDFMGKDHDRLDGTFKEFQSNKDKDLKKAIKLFAEFKIGLQRHIIWEEDILFPFFEEKTGMREAGPTAVMRMEHRKIKGFLEKIHDKIAEGDMETDEFEKGLLEVLASHNHKEENVLYPWLDDSLTKEEIYDAFERMNNLPPEKYNKCCE